MLPDHDTWKWQEPGEAWRGAGLYHITLKIPTREPLLGDLVIPDNDPTKAYVKCSSLGAAVLDVLRGVSSFYPEIQILHYCLMPDHLHMIWYVRQAMPSGIRMVVSGFRSAAQKLGRAFSYYDEAMFSSVAPTASREKYQENTLRKQLGNDAYYALPSIFTEMPHIRPMGQRRQLPTTIHYIDMNPQRLATMRIKPGFFRVQDHIEIGGRVYSGIGNSDLLQEARYMPVHVRHTMLYAAAQGNPEPLSEYMERCIAAAQKGAVMVSPFIHEKEREVLYSVLAQGGKVIYLTDNGFREYYKPSDGIFDAVASKQVLILSPWVYDPKKRGITRAECIALNGMAEEICTFSSVGPTAVGGNTKKI